VRLSPETCRVKPLRIKNAIVASWTYFTTTRQAMYYRFGANIVAMEKP